MSLATPSAGFSQRTPAAQWDIQSSLMLVTVGSVDVTMGQFF